MNFDDNDTRTAIAVSSFLGLHVIAAWAESGALWGVDFLRYAVWPWIVSAVGVGLVFTTSLSAFSSVRRPLVRVATSPRIAPFLLLLAALCLPSSRHVLGDGYLLIRELDAEAWETLTRTDRAPLTFWALIRVQRTLDALGGDAEMVYRTISIVSGVLYAGLSPLVASRLVDDRRRQSIITLSLLTGGYLQLFFGYAENYAPLYPGMLLLVLFLTKTLRRSQPLWPASLVLAVMCSLHFSAVFLFPSVLYAAYRAHRTHGFARPLLEVGLCPVLILLILWSIEFDFITYLAEARDHTLPLLDSTDGRSAYGFLSFLHFLDLLNACVLSAPAAILFLITTPVREYALDDTGALLLSLCLGPLLFVTIANPEIGAFRDWDVLALPALSLTALTAYTWSGRRPTSRSVGWVVGAAGLHLLLWIGINAHPASAETRYQTLLNDTPLSTHGQVYGWETLGTLQRGNGDDEGAVRSYSRALEANPNHHRLWLLLGNAYQKLNRLEAAESAYQKTLDIRPHTSEAHSNLGVILVLRGEYQRALEHLDRATELRPDYPEAWMNRGVALANQGETGDAIDSLRRAIELDSSYGNAYRNLAMLYVRIGRQDSAQIYNERALALTQRSAP